jgi:transposase
MARGPQAEPLRISREQRPRLELLAHRTRAGHALVMRARIIVFSAKGMGTAAVAERVGCADRTVRKWKKRFRECPMVRTLEDKGRSGRPARIAVTTRCQLVKLACERPEDDKAPFRDIWTYKSLAEALHIETGVKLSVSEVGRVLRFHEIRPHHIRYWLNSQDPEFEIKAERICQLYLAPPEGSHVICVDEKPMQALERLHPTERGPHGEVQFEYEYVRWGTCCLLGAFDTQTGQVFGRVVPQRTAEELVEFMERLAARYPTGDVYIIWDNLNTHYDGPDQRWQKFNARHGHRFHFVYTPIHASWMNQVEVWFSILGRRVLRCGSFDSTTSLGWRVHEYIWHWNHHEAHPFRWTWRSDRVQHHRPKRKAA